MVKKYCAYYIKQINDYVSKRANNEFRKQDLTLSQHTVLSILCEFPNNTATMKSIEHELGVAQSTTAGIVERLVKKGLVEKWDSSEDKRVKVVGITPKGLSVVEETEHDVESGDMTLFGSLTEQEHRALYELLQKVCENIE